MRKVNFRDGMLTLAVFLAGCLVVGGVELRNSFSVANAQVVENKKDIEKQNEALEAIPEIKTDIRLIQQSVKSIADSIEKLADKDEKNDERYHHEHNPKK